MYSSTCVVNFRFDITLWLGNGLATKALALCLMSEKVTMETISYSLPSLSNISFYCMHSILSNKGD